jgi:hypothetical protein
METKKFLRNICGLLSNRMTYNANHGAHIITTSCLRDPGEARHKMCHSSWNVRFSQPRLWRALSSRIWRHVFHWKSTDVSEEHFFNFIVKNKLREKPAWSRWQTEQSVAEASDYVGNRMEATLPSDKSVDIPRNTRCYTPEDRSLNNLSSEYKLS